MDHLTDEEQDQIYAGIEEVLENMFTTVANVGKMSRVQAKMLVKAVLNKPTTL